MIESVILSWSPIVRYEYYAALHLLKKFSFLLESNSVKFNPIYIYKIQSNLI